MNAANALNKAGTVRRARYNQSSADLTKPSTRGGFTHYGSNINFYGSHINHSRGLSRGGKKAAASIPSADHYRDAYGFHVLHRKEMDRRTSQRKLHRQTGVQQNQSALAIGHSTLVGARLQRGGSNLTIQADLMNRKIPTYNSSYHTEKIRR